MIKTAVVILNWNGEAYLKRFLPSVLSHSSPENTQVVVGDNGSTDGSVSLLEKEFPEVHLIKLDKNYGFSEGYNRILRQVSAGHYVILNSDIEVTPGWLDPLINILAENPQIAVVMPKIKSFERQEYFEHAGAAGGFIDKFGYPFCRGRILNNIEKDQGQYDQECEVFWATGACMCIKADIFHKFGGFDDYMFAHMEEIDLCWRIKNAGFKILFTPESTVYHVGGGTLPNEHPQKLYLNFRNNLILLYKNLPPGNKAFVFFMRFILDGVAALKFLAGFKPAHMAAIFRAHWHFYRILPKYKKDLKNQTLKIAKLPEELYRKSILLNFYILRRKTYTDLKQ